MSRDIKSELWVGVEIDKISNTALSNFIGDIKNFSKEDNREGLIEAVIGSLPCQDELDY